MARAPKHIGIKASIEMHIHCPRNLSPRSNDIEWGPGEQRANGISIALFVVHGFKEEKRTMISMKVVSRFLTVVSVIGCTSVFAANSARKPAEAAAANDSQAKRLDISAKRYAVVKASIQPLGGSVRASDYSEMLGCSPGDTLVSGGCEVSDKVAVLLKSAPQFFPVSDPAEFIKHVSIDGSPSDPAPVTGYQVMWSCGWTYTESFLNRLASNVHLSGNAPKSITYTTSAICEKP